MQCMNKVEIPQSSDTKEKILPAIEQALVESGQAGNLLHIQIINFKFLSIIGDKSSK